MRSEEHTDQCHVEKEFGLVARMMGELNLHGRLRAEELVVHRTHNVEVEGLHSQSTLVQETQDAWHTAS
jgi:hypothetical protein